MKKEKVHDNAIKDITETGALKMGKITEEKRAEASEKNFQNDPNVIYIQMLGGFSMTYQGQPLLLGKSLSSKMLHLLMLLIYSRGEGIRRTRLLEQLYGDSDIEQAANSLRAMIFRLRKSLVAAGLPDGEYISTKGGIYMWAAEQVDVELDVEVFQKQVMAALEEKDPLKEVELLEEACGLLDMESDAEDEEEEETEWEQISQCVEEMENLESVDSGPKDKKKAAALDRLEELFDKELLDILLPAGTAISQNAVSLKGIPSASKYQNDTESSDTEGTGLLEAASRQMAVNAYVPLYFSSFLKENESEPSALRYEMEYLLAGKKSDRENLKDAVNRVLTLRGAMNLLFLLNSPDKKAEADALAAAVSVGIVPAQMALSFFILTLWAFGEAVLDVKMLLAGGKIPFWKTEGTWKTCLSGLLDQSFLKETGESSGDGRTYTEYLSCLIFLMDRKTRNFRIMDLIQWNIRTEQADFSVANCAYQIEIEAEVLQKHMFFQKEEYKGTVYVAGSY